MAAYILPGHKNRFSRPVFLGDLTNEFRIHFNTYVHKSYMNRYLPDILNNITSIITTSFSKISDLQILIIMNQHDRPLLFRYVHLFFFFLFITPITRYLHFSFLGFSKKNSHTSIIYYVFF